MVANSYIRPVILVAVFILTTVLLSCKTMDGGQSGDPNYASDAEANLKRGNEALESKNYIEAERYFEYVKSKYPFLDAAKEAELRLGDTDFERDQFVEARDRYTNFVKLHPTHPKIDYAAFRVALTHFKEIPSNFFLLPSPSEKDQTEVKATLASMNDFVRQYPQSTYAAEAKKLVNDTRHQLVEHELYVADFYAKREKWAAVAERFKKVIQEYSGVGYDERAYFGLHDAYLKLNNRSGAQETLRLIIEKLPDTAAAAKAKEILGKGG